MPSALVCRLASVSGSERQRPPQVFTGALQTRGDPSVALAQVWGVGGTRDPEYVADDLDRKGLEVGALGHSTWVGAPGCGGKGSLVRGENPATKSASNK